MKIIKLSPYILLCFLFFSNLTFADIAFRTENISGATLRIVNISGQINDADLKAYQTLRETFKPNGKSVNNTKYDLLVGLNSTGGKIDTAIKLGRLIRIDEANTIVGEKHLCYSSCVLLLAAGVKRFVDDTASVGIHRPYKIIDNTTNAHKQKIEQSKVENLVKKYLSFVSISNDLYDDMVRISPDEIKILSKSEMQHYGLNLDDPFFEDAKTAEHAKSMNLSTKEYRQRRIRDRQYCFPLMAELNESESNKCYEAIMLLGHESYP